MQLVKMNKHINLTLGPQSFSEIDTPVYVCLCIPLVSISDVSISVSFSVCVPVSTSTSVFVSVSVPVSVSCPSCLRRRGHQPAAILSRRRWSLPLFQGTPSCTAPSEADHGPARPGSAGVTAAICRERRPTGLVTTLHRRAAAQWTHATRGHVWKC